MEQEDVFSHKLRWFHTLWERLVRFFRNVRFHKHQQLYREGIAKMAGIRFYEEQKALVLAALAQQEQYEKDRVKFAILMQRLWRGKTARNYFWYAWIHTKQARAATKIQLMIRRRRAWNTYCARRRALANRSRVYQARAIQGKMLRAIGFTQRRTQRAMMRRTHSP